PAHSDGFGSNFGGASVDLAAPGVNIGSTVPPGVVAGCGASAYCGFSGTSMATPFVGGGAALVLAAEPDLTVAQLKARLLGAVDVIPSLAGQVVTGGRFNVCKAIPGCGTIAAAVPTAPRDLNVSVGHGQATVTWSA